MYITQENAYTGGFLFIINVDRQTASSLQMSSGRVIFPTILLHTRLLRNSKNWDNTTLKTRQLKTRDQLSCGPSAAAGGSLYNFLPSWDLEIWLMERRAQERYLWVTFYLQKGGKEGVIYMKKYKWLTWSKMGPQRSPPAPPLHPTHALTHWLPLRFTMLELD